MFSDFIYSVFILGGCFTVFDILGKINKSKATPREIYAIAITLGKIPDWQEKLSKTNVEHLIDLSNIFRDSKKIVNNIIEKINQDAPVNISQGSIIKNGVNEELDDLRILLKNGKNCIFV